jgi:hypothetical protein
MRGANLALCALGLAVVASGWAAVASTYGWPVGIPLHLALFLAAGAIWAGALVLLARIPRAPGQAAIVLAVALTLRAPAWMAPPSHSDDVWRFVWDGRVQRAGMNPFLHAPEAPELAPLRDADFTRINHRKLPTIYPPGAQLLFRGAAYLPLPPLVAWKIVIALFDVGLLVLLLWWLGRRGGDPRRAIVWGWSPLVAIELGQNAHVDGAGVALFIAALAALELGRAGRSGALLALSIGIKPLGLALLPRLRRWRAFGALAVVLALVALPFYDAGTRLGGSLGEYGRRWRTSDGLFALVHAGARTLVQHSRFAERTELPEHPRLARLVSGRDRDQVYPDEVANLLARALVGAAWLGVIVWAWRRRLAPVPFAGAAIGAFLLLTPALHPWYVLWILPIAAASSEPAWIALAVLAPLGYTPVMVAAAGGPWQEATWPRELMHGTVVTLLLAKRLTRGEGPVISEDS